MDKPYRPIPASDGIRLRVRTILAGSPNLTTRGLHDVLADMLISEGCDPAEVNAELRPPGRRDQPAGWRFPDDA